MTRSPVVILYDSAGTPMAVQDGVAYPANTPRIPVAGRDDADVARSIRTADDGTVRVDPTGTTTQPVDVVSSALPDGAATEGTSVEVLAVIQELLERNGSFLEMIYMQLQRIDFYLSSMSGIGLEPTDEEIS